MDPLQFATLTQHLHNPEALSALPDAPVVPEPVARWARSRRAAAAVLHRVADVVAPDPAPFRPKLAGAHK
jgi:hypothetical protein